MIIIFHVFIEHISLNSHSAMEKVNELHLVVLNDPQLPQDPKRPAYSAHFKNIK